MMNIHPRHAQQKNGAMNTSNQQILHIDEAQAAAKASKAHAVYPNA
jgi:hypothetical protein